MMTAKLGAAGNLPLTNARGPHVGMHGSNADARMAAAHPSLHVLGAPFHDRIGVEFLAARSPHILNRMALAQCASCPEGIIHRRQQSGPFQLGVTILEIVNLPVLRFAHFFSPFAFSPISTGHRIALSPAGVSLIALCCFSPWISIQP